MMRPDDLLEDNDLQAAWQEALEQYLKAIKPGTPEQHAWDAFLNYCSFRKRVPEISELLEKIHGIQDRETRSPGGVPPLVAAFVGGVERMKRSLSRTRSDKSSESWSKEGWKNEGPFFFSEVLPASTDVERVIGSVAGQSYRTGILRPRGVRRVFEAVGTTGYQVVGNPKELEPGTSTVAQSSALDEAIKLWSTTGKKGRAFITLGKLDRMTNEIQRRYPLPEGAAWVFYEDNERTGQEAIGFREYPEGTDSISNLLMKQFVLERDKVDEKFIRALNGTGLIPFHFERSGTSSAAWAQVDGQGLVFDQGRIVGTTEVPSDLMQSPAALATWTRGERVPVLNVPAPRNYPFEEVRRLWAHSVSNRSIIGRVLDGGQRQR